MAYNANAEEVSRTEDSTPNRESNTKRNRTGRRNVRNAGSDNRQIRYFSGETKDIEVILTLVTNKVNKEVTFERFQETL